MKKRIPLLAKMAFYLSWNGHMDSAYALSTLEFKFCNQSRFIYNIPLHNCTRFKDLSPLYWKCEQFVND